MKYLAEFKYIFYSTTFILIKVPYFKNFIVTEQLKKHVTILKKYFIGFKNIVIIKSR